LLSCIQVNLEVAMKRLLYAIPILASPLLLALHRDDKPVKSDKPQPPSDAAVPAKVETATFALG
jgi:hypothetical protein